MTYLRNAWYMAAWADEITEDKPLARRLLDEPVFIYRDGDTLHALFDRCPHRFAPLSLGHVEGSQVTCIYHGLTFGGDGRCKHNPHGKVSKALSVRSYPVVEAYRAVWVWMGDPAKVAQSVIPDLGFLSAAPATAFNQGYLLGKGHYQLFVDNILDLTHADYLHPTTLGGGAITRTPPFIEEREDGTIFIAWRPMNEVPMPLVADRLPPGVERVDSWTEVEWSAPGVMKLVNGLVPSGTPREKGGNVFNVHILTPETENKSHYFFASTRDFRIDDADYNEQTRRTREYIFATEDEPVIAAQQERISDSGFWGLKPALLSIDKGAVLVRRRMDALIAAESDRSTID